MGNWLADARLRNYYHRRAHAHFEGVSFYDTDGDGCTQISGALTVSEPKKSDARQMRETPGDHKKNINKSAGPLIEATSARPRFCHTCLGASGPVQYKHHRMTSSTTKQDHGSNSPSKP